MKEYIEKDAAIEFVKSLIDTMSVCTSIDECLGMKSMKSRALGALHDVPAADVVEVDVKDLRVKKAIQTLCEFYSTAKKSDYVQKPLAWALYQTWKSFDKMDGGVNDADD